MEVSSKTLSEIDDAKSKENLMTLEAVFFVSGRFLSMPDLISLTDLNPIIIRELIEKLQEKYSKRESALEIVEKGGLWKMDVRPEYAYLINKLATGSAEFSKAEQETLAIIAYKQPIKQSVIIKIRGNKAYDHVKKFSELGLIKKKKLGHTNELSLHEDFYDYFNVSGSNPLKSEIAEDSENDDAEDSESENESEVEENADGSADNEDETSDSSEVEVVVESESPNVDIEVSAESSSESEEE